jgi:GMP synthase-like glutamine amidotransferase
VGAVLLASSARCKVQAFVLPGVQIYGVQFHPERSKADYETILTERGKAYAGDLSSLDAIRASLKETPQAADIMAKFIDRIVLQK